MKVEKIWLEEDAVWIRTEDGKEYKERFADYPGLKHASTRQLAKYEVWGGGIHWPALNEDLSFEGFTQTKNVNPLYQIFIAHPELNASAVARRLGMSQSLFAQYVSGTKKPSENRFEKIMEEIRAIGRELSTL